MVKIRTPLHRYVGMISRYECPLRSSVCRASDPDAMARDRVRDDVALNIYEPPEADSLRSGQRPQPVDGSQ